MINYRNNLPSETDCSMEKIAEFESRYKEILYQAKEEYEYIPSNKYYKEGYNLYLRMEKYMSNHLLFLHNYRIPTTNNEAERLLRGYKKTDAGCVIPESSEYRLSLSMHEHASYDAQK